jgi:hypothetical protein
LNVIDYLKTDFFFEILEDKISITGSNLEQKAHGAI